MYKKYFDHVCIKYTFLYYIIEYIYKNIYFSHSFKERGARNTLLLLTEVSVKGKAYWM